MTVKDHRELACWQLSAQLRDEVIPILDNIPFPKDLDLCRDLSRSARSAPANIAEGFGRIRPLDSARFYEFARGSLMETLNHLIDGRDRGDFEAALCSRLSNLTRAALRTTTALWRSKQRQAASESSRWPAGRRR